MEGKVNIFLNVNFVFQLMEVFKVAPYDQNLMVNGEYLTENHLTLGQLKVLPGSLIFLRVRSRMLNKGSLMRILMT